jgi:argininosuccinate synthase
MAQRVVLAYSGGLDTSVAVRWLIENRGAEVIAGRRRGPGPESSGDWDAIRHKALAGAVEATVITPGRDGRGLLYARPAANAKYEGKYPWSRHCPVPSS